MTLRTILSIPDPRLRKVCKHVDIFDNNLQLLCDDLIETMYAAPGIGLAAPQIGILKKVIVMDCDKETQDHKPIILINPKIVWASEEKRSYEEGCLSIPETYAEISRADKVKVTYNDLLGKRNETIFSDLWATCVQHEIDHLNGKLFIDYLGSVKRGVIMRKMMKIKRETLKISKDKQ